MVKRFIFIQSRFLWGGMEEKRKIHRVKWKDVNIHFEKGGLGVKNIVWFNVAPLNKWRWRILQGHNSLWFNVLKAHYRDLSSLVFYGGNDYKYSSTASLWGRDILKFNSLFSCDPIVDCSRFTIHNGFNTPFWEGLWLGGSSLKGDFTELIKAPRLKMVSMETIGGWSEGGWIWGDFGLSESSLNGDAVLEEIVLLRGHLRTFKGGQKVKMRWFGKVKRGMIFR